MLKLRPNDYDEIRRHGEETYPHECCGVLLGIIGDDTREVRATVRCGNTRVDSPQNRYNIDPRELVRVQREARERDLERHDRGKQSSDRRADRRRVNDSGVATKQLPGPYQLQSTIPYASVLYCR